MPFSAFVLKWIGYSICALEYLPLHFGLSLPNRPVKLKKTRIVLVDDDPHFIDLFERALLAECTDIRLTSYSSGINFLEAIPLLTSYEQPHLILLDMRMPFLNGLQVAQAIRSHPIHRVTPILLLTAVDEAEPVYQAYEQGANAYLVKPFSWPQLSLLAKHICAYWADMSPLPYR